MDRQGKTSGVIDDDHTGGSGDAHTEENQESQDPLIFIFFPPAFLMFGVAQGAGNLPWRGNFFTRVLGYGLFGRMRTGGG